MLLVVMTEVCVLRYFGVVGVIVYFALSEWCTTTTFRLLQIYYKEHHESLHVFFHLCKKVKTNRVSYDMLYKSVILV